MNNNKITSVLSQSLKSIDSNVLVENKEFIEKSLLASLKEFFISDGNDDLFASTANDLTNTLVKSSLLFRGFPLASVLSKCFEGLIPVKIPTKVLNSLRFGITDHPALYGISKKFSEAPAPDLISDILYSTFIYGFGFDVNDRSFLYPSDASNSEIQGRNYLAYWNYHAKTKGEEERKELDEEGFDPSLANSEKVSQLPPAHSLVDGDSDSDEDGFNPDLADAIEKKADFVLSKELDEMIDWAMFALLFKPEKRAQAIVLFKKKFGKELKMPVSVLDRWNYHVSSSSPSRKTLSDYMNTLSPYKISKEMEVWTSGNMKNPRSSRYYNAYKKHIDRGNLDKSGFLKNMAPLVSRMEREIRHREHNERKLQFVEICREKGYGPEYLSAKISLKRALEIVKLLDDESSDLDVYQYKMNVSTLSDDFKPPLPEATASEHPPPTKKWRPVSSTSGRKTISELVDLAATFLANRGWFTAKKSALNKLKRGVPSSFLFQNVFKHGFFVQGRYLNSAQSHFKIHKSRDHLHEPGIVNCMSYEKALNDRFEDFLAKIYETPEEAAAAAFLSMSLWYGVKGRKVFFSAS
jgi:hypothetical protein